MGELRVRRLERRDAARVAELLDQLWYANEAPEVEGRIEAWSSDTRAVLLGADLDGRLVGCAAVYVVPFFERPGARARLVALVVDDGVRGQGVGRRLVAEAWRLAVARGAVEMELTSRVQRPEAHGFYPALGFEDVTERSRRYLLSEPGISERSGPTGT